MKKIVAQALDLVGDRMFALGHWFMDWSEYFCPEPYELPDDRPRLKFVRFWVPQDMRIGQYICNKLELDGQPHVYYADDETIEQKLWHEVADEEEDQK